MERHTDSSLIDLYAEFYAETDTTRPSLRTVYAVGAVLTQIFI